MEHGKLLVLPQPLEFVIFGGAAIGTVSIANPVYILKQIVGNRVSVLRGSPFNKKRYPESPQMMFELLTKARKDRLVAVEKELGLIAHTR
jgi:chemotaxis protein MotA